MEIETSNLTVDRRRKNKILALKDSQGEWCSDQNNLPQKAISFFGDLYEDDRNGHVVYGYSDCFPCLSTSDYSALDDDMDFKEVRRAVFDMHPYKAPRVDGFHEVFYQKHWEVVQHSVYRFVVKPSKIGTLKNL